jgi:SAM-dependent methyltransferase
MPDFQAPEPADLPFSHACVRNREPILQVLQQHLPARSAEKPQSLRVLEIGSGTGQHAAYFAAALPHVLWQTSDVAANLPGVRGWLAHAGLPNTPAPLTLAAQDLAQHPPLQGCAWDAVYTANTLHIMAWPQVEQLFAALPRLLAPGGLLLVYGPFNLGGAFTSEGNAQFDASLRQADPARGIRDFEAVDALAQGAGFTLLQSHELPANNRCIVWQRVA